jgi:hypothetical protein
MNKNFEDSIGDFCNKMEQSFCFNDYDKDVISFENIVGDGGEQKYEDYEKFRNNKLNVGEKIEDIIKTTVHNILNKSKNVEMPNDVVFTDNFGEILEKLIILTTRVWYLEDRIGELILLNDPKYNQEIVDLKKKIDICFKQKRPNYIQSLNRIIEAAILNGKKIEEDSVKLYKGY